MSNSSKGMGDGVVSFDDVIDRVIPAVAGRDDLVDVRTMTVYKPDGVVLRYSFSANCITAVVFPIRRAPSINRAVFPFC